MIRSFADPETERIWQRQRSRKMPSDIQSVALRKMLLLDSVEQLQELRIPSGNRFEQLKGYNPLRYNVRINDQWRICFRWTATGPADVQIVDYH